MENHDPEYVWQLQILALKQEFPFLETADFTFDYGMKDVMMDKLQQRLGKDREQLNALLSSYKQKQAP